MLEREDLNLAHAVLLYKIDSKYFCIKNTDPNEPIIKIPVDRATSKQKYIRSKGVEEKLYRNWKYI